MERKRERGEGKNKKGGNEAETEKGERRGSKSSDGVFRRKDLFSR